MQLQQVKLDIPQIIVEVEEYIQKMIEKEKEKKGKQNKSNKVANMKEALENEYCFGAGAFSNLYIDTFTSNPIKGNVINDIDIYVDYTLFNESFILNHIPGIEDFDMEDHRSGGYAVQNWDTIREIARFTYKGFKFQVISLYHMEKLWYFDFRFRNFYYKEGKVFASQGALEDIQNKELVTVAFNTPLASLIRGFKFQYELGFSFSETSIQALLSFLKKEEVDLGRMPDLIRHITNSSPSTEYVERKMDELLQGKTSSKIVYGTTKNTIFSADVEYPFPEKSNFILNCYNFSIGEDNYDVLLNYKENQVVDKEIIVADYNYHYFVDFFKENKHYFADVIRKIAFVNLAKDFTTGDFDLAEELLEIDTICLEKHKQQIRELVTILVSSLRCIEARDILPQRFQDHLLWIAKSKWSVRISHDFQDILGSLHGEKIILHIQGQRSGKFEMRKVQDGYYVLSHTEGDGYYYYRGPRKQLIASLQREFGNFRLGVEGDTAIIRDFGTPGYWFRWNSGNQAVLKRNQ